MSHYIPLDRDVAIYGSALFAVAVVWQIVAAIYQRSREPRLPLSGKSYDSASASGPPTSTTTYGGSPTSTTTYGVLETPEERG